jgi:hypothetical protein
MNLGCDTGLAHFGAVYLAPDLAPVLIRSELGRRTLEGPKNPEPPGVLNMKEEAIS